MTWRPKMQRLFQWREPQRRSYPDYSSNLPNPTNQIELWNALRTCSCLRYHIRGGWKLVIATRNHTACMPWRHIVKGKIDSLVCLEQNSLSGYRQVSRLDRPLWHFITRANFPCRFPRKYSNALRTRAIAVDLEPTWQHLLSEFRLKQTKVVCVNQFHYLLWPLYGSLIITSFT